jgi:DNA-binding XRE family transcriptional regulator
MAAMFGPHPLDLAEAELKEKQSRELLALTEEKMAALIESQAKLPHVDPPPVTLTRKESVQKLLDEKGWSILDWANEAGVSHATAMDYLQGKTTPYRSTRLKLAKALGVPVEQLPK